MKRLEHARRELGVDDRETHQQEAGDQERNGAPDEGINGRKVDKENLEQ